MFQANEDTRRLSNCSVQILLVARAIILKNVLPLYGLDPSKKKKVHHFITLSEQQGHFSQFIQYILYA